MQKRSKTAVSRKPVVPNGQKRVRNRPKLKGTYAPLGHWVDFINRTKNGWGEPTNDVPGVPLVAIAAYGVERLREQARTFLIQVVKAPVGGRLEGPPPIYQKQTDRLIEGETVLSKLLDALDPCELSRLRTCPECNKLYLALKSDQEVCSVGCKQKKYYQANLDKERKKARDKMRKRRAAAKAAAKEQERLDKAKAKERRAAWEARTRPIR